MGFDNILKSAFFEPSLTTVNHDQYNLGKVAVQKIIQIIESDWDEAAPIAPTSVILEPTLVVRDSSLRLLKV